MPEIKTNFIKSKMNRDLDDRLIPKGQYRDALNINVSASEGDSVGTVETIKGNLLITDLGYTSECRVKIIGYKEDHVKNIAYFFLTDYTDTSFNKLNNFASSSSICSIVSFNFSSNVATKLVEGYFLNFSLTHPMLGVDLIEELLFFTDNRNQPRKINVSLANPTGVANPTFYSNEDQISVAKYYPYQTISLIEEAVTGLAITNNGGGTVSEPGPYKDLFDSGQAIALPTTGGSGSGLTVNIDNITPTTGAITGVSINEPGIGYQDGDVVNLAPKIGSATLTLTVITQSTMKDRCNEFLAPSVVGRIENVNGNVIEIDSFLSPNPAEGWEITNIDQPQEGKALFKSATGSNTFTITYPTTATGPNTPPGEWVEGNMLTFAAPNPDYDAAFPGDCEYLKERFVRFSYRFKFVDNEYSLAAPFTQECFVPQQDGYIAVGDEQRALDATDLEFFQNKISEIGLMIPCPVDSFSTLNEKMHVEEIEILYKESDQNNIKIVSSIQASEFANNNTKLFKFTYQGRAPYKVLPENETTRTSDAVPIRAQSQAITGNRVIYGNYLNRHTSLDSIDYLVGVDEKTQTTENPTQQEYQNHTLKQNRNYQLGIVLSDRYGRQSDVILSKADDDSQISSGVLYAGSTIYNSYKPSGFDAALISNTTTWPGDNLSVFFNSTIPETYFKTGYPGLYKDLNTSVISDLFPGSTYGTGIKDTTGGNGIGLKVNIISTNSLGEIQNLEISDTGTGYKNGDIITIDGGNNNANFIYNPVASPNVLGWYSYKFVVKQQEQEYYNVYLPGVLNGTLDTSSVDNPNEAKISLFSDNVNKVPKDLSDVGPVQVAFRSNENLFFRVNNKRNYNQQYYPGTVSDKVVQLGTMSDLGIALPIAKQKEIVTASASDDTIIFDGWSDNDNVAIGSQVTAVNTSGDAVAGLTEADEVYVLSYFSTGNVNNEHGKANLSADVTTSVGDVVTFNPPLPIYNGKNNPFIGTVNTNNVLGTRITDTFTTQLAVAETLPFFSDLNIYWETSTSGLISELNDDIRLGSANVPVGITQVFYTQNEGMPAGSVVTNLFSARNFDNTPVLNANAIGVLNSVVDGNGADRKSDFFIDALGNGEFRIKTSNTFVVGSDARASEFTFNVTISVLGIDLTGSFTGVCENIAPVWEDYESVINIDVTDLFNNGWGIGMPYYSFTNIKNGSAATNRSWEEIELEILEVKSIRVNGLDKDDVFPVPTGFGSQGGLRYVPPYLPLGSSAPITGAFNALGYKQPTIYPFVPCNPGENPDGTPQTVDPTVTTDLCLANSGVPIPSFGSSVPAFENAAWSYVMPCYFVDSDYPFSGNYNNMNQIGNTNPQPTDYTSHVFGRVNNSNEIRWFIAGAGLEASPNQEVEYKIRITDGGGLYNDYVFTVNFFNF